LNRVVVLGEEDTGEPPGFNILVVRRGRYFTTFYILLYQSIKSKDFMK